RLSRFLHDDSGSELVEFAMSAMVLLMLIFGIFDVGRAMYSYYFVSYAAQAGTRYAMVRGNGWSNSCSTQHPPNFTMSYGCKVNSSDIQNYVQSLSMPGINQSGITVNTIWPGKTPRCQSNCSACTHSNSQGCLVQVQVNYSFNFMLPFLPSSSV